METIETIFALATVPGRSAIAVIRVSGPHAHVAINALCQKAILPDRRMRLRVLCAPATGEAIDSALVVAFAAESSPTGEIYGEFHTHGGVAAPEAVLTALGLMDGLRLAEPGEFSRRAIENQRLDLTQVEGVADLVNAETQAQRRQALKLAQGGLSGQVAQWRGALVEALALIAASIDFADDDIPDDLATQASQIASRLADEMRDALRGATAGRIVREGFEVAIIGAPNVGKSSLLNMLGGRDVALTSDMPGTTRDVIELRCVVDGHLVTFLDTAGLREALDPVEQAGVALARKRAAAADLRIVVWAPDCPREPDVDESDILVWNKADIASGPGLNVSVKTASGGDVLMREIAGRLSGLTSEAGVVVRERHRVMLQQAVAHLDCAGGLCDEFVAEELRLAARALDRLVGRVDCEEVLGEIFSTLCIGK